MPPTFRQPHTLSLGSWPRVPESAWLFHSESLELRIPQTREDASLDGSKPDCKGHKAGIDFGPCGNKSVNYIATSLIICAVVLFFVAVFLRTKCSRVEKRAFRPTHEISSRDTRLNQQRRRRRREPQMLVPQRRIHSDSRRQSLQARAVTDVSQQRGQLAGRLAELHSQLESALLEQERRALEAWADRSRLRTLEAAHLRDRERDWELYQLRSNQDILARFERAGSVIHRMRSNEQENQLDITVPVQPEEDVPPVYSAEDPLMKQNRPPPYDLGV
ncbi:MAG: hypothetical protein Q9181_003602 [Wetmoreana brouardii]